MIAHRPYLRPSWLVSHLLNPLVMWVRATPVLAVVGRRSGEWRRVPVEVLHVDGARYLVAPRGETQWARNLRAAGGGRIETRATAETFRAVEVSDAEKPPLIAAYLERWGRLVGPQFKALPDPADHPVFRIEPVQA